MAAAWRALLPQKLAHRNGFTNLNFPCAVATAAALRRFPPREQKLIALSITGAYQSPAAQAVWDPLCDGLCPLCGAAGTRAHQLLHCPATQSLRAKHADTLQWMHAFSPHWVHGCFGVEHDCEGFLRLNNSSRDLPAETCIRSVVRATGLQQLHFYTDGSLRHPACPQASHGGWSVVLDLAPDTPAAVNRAYWSQHLEPMPELVVAACGLIPKVQTIHRAELCAAVQACRLASQVPEVPSVIHIDSASALQALTLALQGTSLNRMMSRDILRHVPVSHVKPSLCKIRAHQDPEGVPDVSLRQVLGNRQADHAAGKASDAEMSRVQEDAHEVASWRRTQAHHLVQYYAYLVDLAKLVAPQKRAIMTEHRQATAVEERFRATAWLAQNPLGLPVPGLGALPDQVVLGLVWPPWFTTSLWRWASRLGWQQEPQEQSQPGGVTYLELLLNYIVTEKLLPPKLVGRSCRGRYLNLLQDEGRLLPFTSQELLLSFAAALRALAKGTGSVLLHGPPHHRIRTLAMFKGEDQGRKGVLSRPMICHAQETYELLHSFLVAKVSDTLRHYCLQSSPPTTVGPCLQRRWEAAAGSRQRKALGRAT